MSDVVKAAALAIVVSVLIVGFLLLVFFTRGIALLALVPVILFVVIYDDIKTDRARRSRL